ncbi:MAG: GGDEF domain-containing protein [Desulfosalsimonas sp.]
METHFSDDKLQKKQTLRKKRHAMAFATYLVPLTVALLCWHYNLAPIRAVYYFAVLVLIISLSILFAIHKNLNLKLRDPSMTVIHVSVSAIPMLWVMYFLEAGHARAVFMMFLVVAALYGILELNFRRFLMVCLWMLCLYGILVLLLWWRKPQTLVFSMELIQAIAFVMVMITTAMLGGFISSLRSKLRKRNTELRDAIERIEELLNIDSLTGVNNRRHLFDVLCGEINRCNRGNMSFSILLLDLDNFKKINDTYGHLAGDEILCRIASSLSERTRIIDTFGRYGGEEFLMVLPQTPLEGAVTKAEKMRQQVETLTFSDIAKDLRITISIGVAAHRPGEHLDNTLLRVDQALYAAKDKGRNRVATEHEAAAGSPPNK